MPLVVDTSEVFLEFQCCGGLFCLFSLACLFCIYVSFCVSRGAQAETKIPPASSSSTWCYPMIPSSASASSIRCERGTSAKAWMYYFIIALVTERSLADQTVSDQRSAAVHGCGEVCCEALVAIKTKACTMQGNRMFFLSLSALQGCEANRLTHEYSVRVVHGPGSLCPPII